MAEADRSTHDPEPSDSDTSDAGPLLSDATPRARVGQAAYRLAGLPEPFCRGWRWLPAAAVVGTAPLLISLVLGIRGHQVASAVGLALLCLACAREDAWIKGIGTIAVAFLAHSFLAITATTFDPAAMEPLLPDAEDYWQKQIVWIETGCDPEYEFSAWVPAHVQLFAGTVIFSFTSFGALTFYQGFYEVDLMNFYNARLLAHSSSQPLALLFGWHVWSLVRGIGYAFISFEVISLALQWISGKKISSGKPRRLRWTLGLGLLLTDGIIKATLLETVRQQLFANLK